MNCIAILVVTEPDRELFLAVSGTGRMRTSSNVMLSN